MAIMYLLEKP